LRHLIDRRWQILSLRTSAEPSGDVGRTEDAMSFDSPGPTPNPDFSPQPNPGFPVQPIPNPLPVNPQNLEGRPNTTKSDTAPSGKGARRAGLVAAIAAAGALGLWMLTRDHSPAGGGDRSPSNPAVQQVNQKSRPGDEWIGHVARSGELTFVRGVLIGDEDHDSTTTAAVARAQKANDPEALEAALKAAQQIPVLADPQDHGPDPPPLPRREPTVTPELKEKVLNRECEFVRLYAFDCCDEDGDVIEILVNGVSFAVVPLTHRGATVSIPVPKGEGATVTIRGVRDGEGGGITLGLRTSRGDFLFRRLAEGELLPLGKMNFQ
jgi:hypothetical protein